MSVTGIGLTAIPLSTATACGLSVSSKVFNEIITIKNSKYKKQIEKDQQTITFFDALYRKSLQDNVIVTIEHESLCNIFTKYVDETKNESFL